MPDHFPPSITSHHLHCRDIEEYALKLRGPWDLSYDQLSAGEMKIQNSGKLLDNSLVYNEHFNRSTHIQGALNSGLLAFALPNFQTRNGQWWGKPCLDQAIVFALDNREIDLVAPDGYQNRLAIFSEKEFRDEFQSTTGKEADFLDSESPFLSMETGELLSLEKTLKALIENEEIRPVDFSFCREIAIALGAATLHSGHVTPSKRKVYVKRAIQRWEDSGYRISIKSLCVELHVSQSALENWFRVQVGYSPYQYFKRRRLNLAHRALYHGNPTTMRVTDIAMRYRFNELGRFSVTYRKHFGESPSQTLQQIDAREQKQSRS